MTDREKASELYQMYPFRKSEDFSNCSVFVFDGGYFMNAEIVAYSNAPEIQTIKNDYESSGYSVTVKPWTSYEEFALDLYKGFFKVNATKESVKKDYIAYKKKQSEHLGGLSYTYIESSYLLNGKNEYTSLPETICNILYSEDAQLIILEAPAGFGKTCTSYEVSNILANSDGVQIPLLAELSRNRSARLFKYVLLDEMDRKFSQPNQEMGYKQIQEGRIILIVDGFDELISKIVSDGSEDTEDAQSMLDTIASMFSQDSRAKVLLTSRKSSIFTGELFDDWVERKLNNCTITRIQILQPTIEDWIGNRREQLLKDKGVNLNAINNPVLLTALKNMTPEQCGNFFTSASDVLDYYFELLLNRERERQMLLLKVDEQKEIMSKLAAAMVQLNISSDEPEGIKSLLEDIVANKITEYLERYAAAQIDKTEKRTDSADEFLNRLLHSALLDRIKPNCNDIGFINEYIYGILIGNAIIHNWLNANDLTDKYFTLAVMAFTAETTEKKNILYSKIYTSNLSLHTNQKLLIDIQLLERLSHDYVDEYIMGINFSQSFTFDNQHYFYNCIFTDCIFSNIVFENNIFEGCYFYNCHFYNITVRFENNSMESSVFQSCTGHFLLQEKLSKSNELIIDVIDTCDYEKKVLEQFWMIGSDRAENKKSIHTLFKGFNQKERKLVADAIESLQKKNMLKKLTYCFALNTSKMSQINEILGREIKR